MMFEVSTIFSRFSGFVADSLQPLTVRTEAQRFPREVLYRFSDAFQPVRKPVLNILPKIAWTVPNRHCLMDSVTGAFSTPFARQCAAVNSPINKRRVQNSSTEPVHQRSANASVMQILRILN